MRKKSDAHLPAPLGLAKEPAAAAATAELLKRRFLIGSLGPGRPCLRREAAASPDKNACEKQNNDKKGAGSYGLVGTVMGSQKNELQVRWPSYPNVPRTQTSLQRPIYLTAPCRLP
jgi:hypothetical protein